MTSIKLRGRRWPSAVLLALAALAIGAIFGTAHNGGAAVASPPSNATPPTVSGTPQVGQTLISTDGTWNGTAPFSYSYTWDRCDANAQNCTAISGANQNSYTVQQADVGSTLEASVTATNAGGSATAPSAATAAVTTVAVTGCPSGTGAIQIADLTPPARLAIGSQSINPSVVTRSSTSIQVQFTVTACGGRPVQGALVYVTAVPYNQYTIPAEATTGADGTAVLTMTQKVGFPATSKQEHLVMFVRARKAGDPITAGVSTRLLVSFPVSLKS